MRNTVNELRKVANKLKKESNILILECENLTEEVERLVVKVGFAAMHACTHAHSSLCVHYSFHYS